jgi:glycosyltransferase involved in cell wall biosynthesis
MTKYNILIVYDVRDWAYHFRAKALMKYAPEDFSVTISSSFKELLHEEDFHLVFFLPFSHVSQLTEYCNQIGKNPSIVTSFNIGWGYANNWLEQAREYSDAVIINNFQMWDKSGRLPNTFYLPNGVDRDIFKYEVPVENRKPRLLWCGSEFHRKIKGYNDILIPLRDRLKNHSLQLDLRLINSTGRIKYSRYQMAQWYNTGTVYVCASLAEGTPNPALEAASCGCTIVSTPVGNMPELIEHGINGYIVKWDVEAFLEHALTAINHQAALSQNMLKAIESWSWAERSKEFYSLFRKLIEIRSHRFSHQL